MDLSDTEIRLFETLQNVGDVFQIEVRIAGGWVRDKLLGAQDIMDIDVVVEHINPKTFAQAIPCAQFSTIHANEQKNKNIEIVTVYQLGDAKIDMDIVQFRGANAKEDAMARDLTINALFYNLKTREIEDWTEKGKDDLLFRIARAPRLEQTFLDDPLRILRTVRFACRFSLRLDEETVQAGRNEKVQELFKKCTSRNRIGEEVMHLLNKYNALDAFVMMMDDFQLAIPLFGKDASFDVQRFLSLCTGQLRREKLLVLASLVSCFPPTKSRTHQVLSVDLKLSNAWVDPVKKIMAVSPCDFVFTRRSFGKWVRKSGEYWQKGLLFMHRCEIPLSILKMIKINPDLCDAYAWKPVLNGHDICRLLGKTSQELKENLKVIMEALVEEQFETPLTLHQAEQFVLSRFSSN
jgi:tRNA nucleotidyltransferase/poly(A) polymerase